MSKELHNQLARVEAAFQSGLKTMKEVNIETGIMRENICRYVRTLRQCNRIYRGKKRFCSVTKYLAYEWTTNEELKPISEPKQLNLFE